MESYSYKIDVFRNKIICYIHGVLYYRPRQRYIDFLFTTFPLITEIGLLRTCSYYKMKHFLLCFEKNRTDLPGNLRYFRFHFKSLKTRELLTFRKCHCVCIKILAILMLSPNFIQIGPFNRLEMRKMS